MSACAFVASSTSVPAPMISPASAICTTARGRSSLARRGTTTGAVPAWVPITRYPADNVAEAFWTPGAARALRALGNVEPLTRETNVARAREEAEMASSASQRSAVSTSHWSASWSWPSSVSQSASISTTRPRTAADAPRRNT